MSLKFKATSVLKSFFPFEYSTIIFQVIVLNLLVLTNIIREVSSNTINSSETSQLLQPSSAMPSSIVSPQLPNLYDSNFDILDYFDFYPMMDSNGYDIGLFSPGEVEEYADLCSARENCNGFNSNGYLKHTIRNQMDWIKWTDDQNLGLYVKKSKIHSNRTTFLL